MSPDQQYLEFSGLNIQVPEDFLGMCFMRYPVAGTSPIGKIKMGSHRLSQQSDSQWAEIETSAGVYDSDKLAALDSIVTFDRQNGISVIMGLYRTPRFYADDTTPSPAYTDYDTKGPWGHLGECAHPTSLAAVADFVDMIISRYNLPGGAWYDQHGATLGKGIQYWETWNEPGLLDAASNGNTTGEGEKGAGFYWGSKNQLVDLCAAQYDTITALDPSVLVLSPGWSGGNKVSWLGTAGATYPTIQGEDTCDAWCYHGYNIVPPFNRYGTWYHSMLDHNDDTVPEIRAALDAAGYSHLDMYGTECGLDAGALEPTMAAWYDESDEFRFNWIARWLLVHAATGLKMVHPWHWLSNCCSADWQNDTNGAQAGYNWIADNIVGKTITRVRYHTSGHVSVVVDGVELTV